MKMTIEPIDEFQMMNGLLVRVWRGHSDRGTPVVAMVMSVGCEFHDDAGREELIAALTQGLPDGMVSLGYPADLPAVTDDRMGTSKGHA